MSPRLALHFLGLPRLYLDDTPVTTDRRKAIALLAYLAVNDLDRPPQKYSRESLSALLWPDYEQAKAFSNLRRTIWEVHQAVGEDWLIADRESVCLNPKAEIYLDAARFQNLLAQSRQQSDPADRIPLLVESAKLYRNHFLTGFSLKDAYSFNEWAFTESEELRRQLAEALITLSEDYRALGQADKAIPYARRLISLDPLDEAAHRQLMEVYLRAGKHSAALKQYQTCEEILRKELNLDPQPETRALYKKIRKGEIPPAQVEKQIEIITPKHNIPSQLSSFIGREKEADDIANLVAKNRLVTLAGVGGIGKTRLSLQVGQRVLNNYPNGVWFVALDSLSDPSLIPQTVAAVFDIRESSSDRPLIERLIDSLRTKTTLLILDNCENLLHGCIQLTKTLLSNCINLKILTTSREILNMAGESTYYLASLSIPGEDNVSFEQLNAYESIQLFTERAALALSSFKLTNENIQSVVDMCRKLDGIPLAIELAAARVNILQVDEILKQLHHSFALLASNSRTITLRHQTLQALMDGSWGLLTESEQIFMRQLSVFTGGWTLEAAQAACDGDVLNLISALVHKSLIVVLQAEGCETRYRFHEIVRQYAHDKLSESGVEEEIRTRHLKYFLRFSEQAETALKGPTQAKWYALIIKERDNIRSALEWAEKTNVKAGLYLSGRLYTFWEDLAVREGARWLSIFVEKPESEAYPLARAKALLTQGWLLQRLQQFDLAHSTAQESLDLFKVCNDKYGEVDALGLLAATIDNAQAEVLLNQALSLSRELKDRWRQADIIGKISWYGNDYQLGRSYREEAIKLFRELGDWHSLAFYLANLAQLEMLNGDLEFAQKSLDEAVKINQHLNNKALKGDFLGVDGRLAFIRGDYEKARANLQEAATVAHEMGNRMYDLWWSTHLGYVAVREGKLTEARNIFVETTQSFQKDKGEIGVVFVLEGIAGLYVATNEPKRAAQLISWADATREKISDTRPLLEQVDVDKVIAACLVKMGEAEFSDAYDEGQKMSLDEAVAFALQEN